MKTLQFKSGSWHHYVTSEWGGHHYQHTDICTYTRRFFYGVIRLIVFALVILALTGIACFIFGQFLGWVIALILLGWVEPTAIAGAVAFLTSLFALAGTMYGFGIVGLRLFGHASQAVSIKVQDSFIEHGWQAFKEKTCVRVEIK